MAIRILRPDARRGILTPQKPHLQAGGPMTQYQKPSSALDIVNKLMSGAKPDLCISRSLGGLGDVLMTLPTVKAIKKKYGGRVDYATDFRYLDGALPTLLNGNPYIDNVLDWHSLPTENYMAIIDLTCPCIAHEQPLAPPINRIDLFAKHAGVMLEDRTIDYIVTPEENRWAEQYLRNQKIWSMEVILVQPSSSSTNRNLPKETLEKAMAQILSKRQRARMLVLTHDTDDKQTSWKYMKIKQAHNLNVRQIAALTKQSAMVLCQDSSLLHIAGALDIPTVSFFGPTDPRARVNYYPKACAIWPGGSLACSPSWYSKPKCNNACWKKITPEMISETVESMLNHERPPVEDWAIWYPTHTTHSVIALTGRRDPRFEEV